MYNSRMSKIVPFTEARSHLSDLLDDVERHHEHVVISRRGRPVAVLLSTSDWEAIEETLEVLEDADLLAALRESEDDVRAGRLTTLSEVRRDLGVG